MEVKMLIVVFRVVTLCDLVGCYQYYGGTYRLHFLSRRLTRLHGVTTQNTTTHYMIFLKKFNCIKKLVHNKCRSDEGLQLLSETFSMW
jgi:hypothetical protein